MAESLTGLRVLYPIGVGTHGPVLAAEDERKGRVVALKVMVDADPSALALAVERAERSLALRHPFVVRFYGTTEVEGAPALVFELVPGVDLGVLRGRVPPSIALDIACKVARTILVARDRGEKAGGDGLVHGRLRAGHVLVSKSGQVKVLGYAQPAGPWRVSGPPRATWAPELRDGVLSPAGDVYALGALLVEVLGHGPPPEAGRAREAHSAVLDEVDRRLAVRGLDEPARAQVRSMLAFEPGERPEVAGLEDGLDRLKTRLKGPVEAQSGRLTEWASQAIPRLMTTQVPSDEPVQTSEKASDPVTNERFLPGAFHDEEARGAALERVGARKPGTLGAREATKARRSQHEVGALADKKVESERKGGRRSRRLFEVSPPPEGSRRTEPLPVSTASNHVDLDDAPTERVPQSAGDDNTPTSEATAPVAADDAMLAPEDTSDLPSGALPIAALEAEDDEDPGDGNVHFAPEGSPSLVSSVASNPALRRTVAPDYVDDRPVQRMLASEAPLDHDAGVMDGDAQTWADAMRTGDTDVNRLMEADTVVPAQVEETKSGVHPAAPTTAERLSPDPAVSAPEVPMAEYRRLHLPNASAAEDSLEELTRQPFPWGWALGAVVVIGALVAALLSRGVNPDASPMPEPALAPVTRAPVTRPAIEPVNDVRPDPVSSEPAVAPTEPAPTEPTPAEPTLAPEAAKPVETKPVESKPVETKPVESKPVESKPVEKAPTAEAKAVETQPAATTAAATKPTESKAVTPPAPVAPIVKVEPKPAIAEPKPAIAEPKPATAAPKPATSAPVPAATGSWGVQASPAGASAPSGPATVVPRNGRIEVQGDAITVVFRQPGADRQAGWVPAGTYDIVAAFEVGQAPQVVGTVSVTAGSTIVIQCKKSFLRCAPK